MHYETTTTLAPEQALAAAEHYFGKEFATVPTAHTADAVTYQGGGGYVTVRVVGVWPTTVEVTTHAWDLAVRGFLDQLPR